MLKRLFVAKNTGNVSLVKVGGWLVAVASGALLAGVCPVALIPWAKFVVAIGTGTALSGARDVLK